MPIRCPVVVCSAALFVPLTWAGGAWGADAPQASLPSRGAASPSGTRAGRPRKLWRRRPWRARMTGPPFPWRDGRLPQGRRRPEQWPDRRRAAQAGFGRGSPCREGRRRGGATAAALDDGRGRAGRPPGTRGARREHQGRARAWKRPSRPRRAPRSPASSASSAATSPSRRSRGPGRASCASNARAASSSCPISSPTTSPSTPPGCPWMPSSCPARTSSCT